MSRRLRLRSQAEVFRSTQAAWEDPGDEFEEEAPVGEDDGYCDVFENDTADSALPFDGRAPQ